MSRLANLLRELLLNQSILNTICKVIYLLFLVSIVLICIVVMYLVVECIC